MKKYSIQLATITMMIIMMITISCDNQEQVRDLDVQSPSYKEFGQLHNEILDELLRNMVATRAEYQTITKDSLKSISITETTYSVMQRDESVAFYPTRQKLTEVSALSIEAIEDSLSIKEKRVIKNLKIGIQKGRTQEELCSEINHISGMPEDARNAALNFVDTYFASASYWNEKQSEWIAYIDDNIVEATMQRNERWYDRVSWNQVFFSDAYYAWYGTVSSGGNLYVGAGASAVGSLFTVLNHLQ